MNIVNTITYLFWIVSINFTVGNSKAIPVAIKHEWQRNPGVLCTESKNGWTVFASHPEDCSKFFICHGLRAFPIDCAAGTLFDKNLKICNHAYLVDCKKEPLITPTETIKTTTETIKILREKK